MPSSLSHLFVPVPDLEAARRCYVDLLGLEVLMDEGGYVRIGGGGGFHRLHDLDGRPISIYTPNEPSG